METLPTTFSAEAYFETQPPPTTIDQDVQSVRTFLKQQQERRRKVVLVTVRVPIALRNEPGALIPVGCVAEWRNDCSFGTQCVSESTFNRPGRSPRLTFGWYVPPSVLDAPSVRFLDNFSAGKQSRSSPAPLSFSMRPVHCGLQELVARHQQSTSSKLATP